MNNVLIILLGNRDIQVSSDSRKELRGEYYSFFEKNVDGSDFYVIDKKQANEQKLTFIEISKVIWENYDYFIPLLRFELFEKTMQVLEKEKVRPDKIIITTSNQNPLYQQDCYYIALVLQKYIKEKGIVCDLDLCEYNPNEFDKLVPFYVDLFRKHGNGCKRLYISNTGGTPTMRSASHFAGLFQGYRYIAISPNDENESKVYQKQEGQVLRQIVENMLNVYDYQGVLNLPVSNEIKGYCNSALNLYNFSIELTTKENDYEGKSISAISNLYWNMVICFKQGRYADVVGRIFRLEESVGQLLLFLEWKLIGLIDNEGKVKVDSARRECVEEVFENRGTKNKIFLTHFPKLFRKINNGERVGWIFDKRFHKEPTPFECGKQFWYFFFVSLNKHRVLTDFFAAINNNYKYKENPLVELRNKSILGHGVEGVSREDLEKVTGNFELFSVKLKTLLKAGLNINCDDNFSSINAKILANL